MLQEMEDVAKQCVESFKTNPNNSNNSNNNSRGPSRISFRSKSRNSMRSNASKSSHYNNSNNKKEEKRKEDKEEKEEKEDDNENNNNDENENEKKENSDDLSSDEPNNSNDDDGNNNSPSHYSSATSEYSSDSEDDDESEIGDGQHDIVLLGALLTGDVFVTIRGPGKFVTQLYGEGNDRAERLVACTNVAILNGNSKFYSIIIIFNILGTDTIMLESILSSKSIQNDTNVFPCAIHFSHIDSLQ